MMTKSEIISIKENICGYTANSQIKVNPMLDLKKSNIDLSLRYEILSDYIIQYDELNNLGLEERYIMNIESEGKLLDLIIQKAYTC
jgi:hypothetical protein